MSIAGRVSPWLSTSECDEMIQQAGLRLAYAEQERGRRAIQHAVNAHRSRAVDQMKRARGQ